MKNIRVSLEKRDVRLLGELLADMQACIKPEEETEKALNIIGEIANDIVEKSINKIKDRLMASKEKASTAKMNLSIDRTVFCFYLLLLIGNRCWIDQHYDEANRIMIGEVLSKIMAAYRK
jgi:hypothetical protein